MRSLDTTSSLGVDLALCALGGNFSLLIERITHYELSTWKDLPGLLGLPFYSVWPI